MNKYVKLSLHQILLEDFDESIDKIQDAYNQFIETILGDTNISLRMFYNRLVYARLEFAQLLLYYKDIEFDKKDLYSHYVNKSISFIDYQMNIINLDKVSELLVQDKSIISTFNGGEIPVWTGSQADLVEVSYGFRDTGKFNNGKIEINSLVKFLSYCFSYPITDCYDTFNNVLRKRTGSRTRLMDEMKAALIMRMDNSDNGIYDKPKHRVG